MKRLTFYIVVLHSLFLGMGTACAQSLETKAKENLATSDQITLPASQLWVINQNKQVQKQPFMWVVEDPKKARQQPFLQLAKNANKPTKKPGDITKPYKNENLEEFDDVVKDTQKLEGIFTLYRQKENNKIYLEIKPEQLNKNFLATATLESGIGEKGIYSGLPLQDFLFYFQRIDNTLQFVVRNVNFRTREGDPQARSLRRSFSDSVLYNLPIKSIHPQRKTILIDLGDLLLTDLAGLSASLELSASPEQAYFGNAKVFPHNLEVQSILNFTGAGGNLSVLADSRGFTLKLHYSISQLPNNNYQPRLADERVGYFITAYQDLSRDDRDDNFVRYINRWNLEKQDPKAEISPPKKPIVFWIDNAVPLEYRDAIRAGVLMWNQAFLQAGFKDAIEVKQMPDNATWDAADIRYNTIRWINTVDGYFALGPSRVNPLTGEILDADILVDASFVRALKNEYRQIILPKQTQKQTQTPTTLSTLMQNRLLCGNNDQKNKGLIGNLSKLAGEYDLCYGIESANQFAFGALAMSLLANTVPSRDQMQDYIHQYLRLIIAHEVGHTLGLRHNFRGSNLLPPEEMNNREITSTKGLTASVMDYIPPNIAPRGTVQGDYFPDKVGSYDIWAIQYGYTPSGAKSTIAEKSFLAEIAKLSENPELSYSPDEDTSEIDPTSAPWDNSGNVLVYSRWQLDNSRVMWDRLNQGYLMYGDSYSDLTDQFSTIFGNYLQQLSYTIKYIGGQSFYRVNPVDNKGRLPFVAVPVEKQRQALATLQEYVFDEEALKFSPKLLNKLVPSRWYHWGSTPVTGRLDFPVHDLVLFVQSAVLSDLLSSDRLTRIKDIELKSKPGEALTLPEVFNTLQDGIWTEVLQPKGKLEISSLRRGLQRQYVNFLTAMVLRKVDVPEDARTLAWYKLKQLDHQLKRVRSNDEYTKAHLLETRDRIEKALNAPLQGN
ncbi:zinc-dependent metalloprotease [Anabaena aphanizomenioides LEGE 00250]|uniref:Zinc-dependent metalloprotease n=1 Tax=Sphaerospermopsis aphanizomenoides LEGE 00250 TaxID=2777972 RepID=A0ABR9VKN1_9CYAN|nr:zinc-dependent metalloprotease [Sphaerospermopsis aphanizomenoides]MBE9239056.1 zinc-dependent metalloprotease [Sphaerospermopsis aphanizomenoides LEGE 00250]